MTRPLAISPRFTDAVYACQEAYAESLAIALGHESQATIKEETALQAFTKLEVALPAYLMHRTNTDSVRSAYYPAAGLDVIAPIAATDCDRILALDLNRNYMGSTNYDVMEGIRKILNAARDQGVRVTRVDGLRSGQSGPGCVQFHFTFPNVLGQIKPRVLVYHYGQDAGKILLSELRLGCHALMLPQPAYFDDWGEPMQKRMMDSLVTGGVVFFGTTGFGHKDQPLETLVKGWMRLYQLRPLIAASEAIPKNDARYPYALQMAQKKASVTMSRL